jgi:hypothetical protein
MDFNKNINPNYMGILNVELKIFKNTIEINGNVEYDISLEIVNNDNDKLINKINNDFKILDIIRNTNRLEKYKNLIIENEKLILESVHRKKEDIIEVASYMVKKEKEIESYKQKINDLIKQQIPSIQEISINDNDFNNTNSSDIETQTTDIETKDKKTEKTQITDIETKNEETQTSIIKIIDIETQTDIIEVNEEDKNDIQLIEYHLDKNKEYYLEYLNIENITSENKHINIELKYKNLSCIIEIKKNKKNIGPSEIDKFINKYIKNNNYNCGLYISMESEFTKNSNIIEFEINIINKKPVIFISNVSNNNNKIDYAIKLLNYITNYKDINNYNEGEIDCYVTHINNYYNHLVYDITTYDDKIIKNKLKYSNLEMKIEQLINKRTICLNSINDLEKIQTLQFGNNKEEIEVDEVIEEVKQEVDEVIEEVKQEVDGNEQELVELNNSDNEYIKIGLKSLVNIVEDFKSTNTKEIN